MPKIGLGTVQLGLPYGSKVNEGLMPLKEAFSILDTAKDHGISFLDTAIGYGESESRIGEYLRGRSTDFEISTKIPVVAKNIWFDQALYKDFLASALSGSLSRLGIGSIDLLQFHQCDEDFLESRSVLIAMKNLLGSGMCKRIGISVYTPKQAEIASKMEPISTLQIPVNLLDTRFLSEDLLELYAKREITLIARSIFLQGVLHSSAALPAVIKRPELEDIRFQITQCAGGQALETLGMRFIFGNLRETLNIALIGVDSASSLRQNLGILEQKIEDLSLDFLSDLAPIRRRAEVAGLLNPSQWNS